MAFATPRWVRWARASLLVALAGHGLANVFLDEEQFVRAGLEYTWLASVPLLVQSIVLAAVVASLGPLARRSHRRPSIPDRVRISRRFAVFAVSQLALFLVLELTERLAQREPFVDGLLGSGFSLELVFALVSAALLAAMASVTAHVIAAVRRRRRVRRSTGRLRPFPDLRPRARDVIVAGGVRAPPASV
ncbi:MAG TPA: hypothetical protein VEC15_12950 [Actinomycetota bacterium]|jgi:hypothetical protein|nr:hypothetical protein [Actinomycetota bacterium]